jgi:hypothetical protein
MAYANLPPGVEHVTADFDKSLALGRLNENVVAHEFRYQGLPVTQTEGKNDFDLFLPDGRSVEVKLDLRSQATGYGVIEWPTIQRLADLYVYTFTYARVFMHEQFKELYLRGKIPGGGIGDLGYDARLVRNMGREGVPLWQFIRDLKAERNRAA